MSYFRRKCRENGESASAKIIETAEALIGSHGVDGVSLRQISLAAGQRNNYAVQYHFGDLVGLMDAIRMQRTPVVETARVEMLAAVKQAGRQGDTRAIVDVLFLPLLNFRNANGDRSFARFVLAVHSTPDSTRNGQIFGAMPAAEEAFRLLHAANPGIPFALLLERMRLISIMVLLSVFNRRAPYDGVEWDAPLIDNALDMASAALVAAISPPVVKLMDAG
ncbi:MAG TPA: hypothetical protein VGE05_13560 [Novosphingobium sp.]